MIEALRLILRTTLDRLWEQAVNYLPSILASVIILAVAWLIAALMRFLVLRLFRGAAIDRFLRTSGLNSVTGGVFSLGATRLAAAVCFWGVLLVGVMTALSTLNSALIARLTEQAVMLLPKLVTAAIIVLGGLWLGQYLSRSALIWACNQRLPSAHNLAGLVRIAVVFLSVVVAADHLNFARGVFLSAFVICLAGIVLAISLSAGLGRHDMLNWLSRRESRPEETGREWSLWNHL